MRALLDAISQTRVVADLARAVGEGGRHAGSGSFGSSTTLVAAALGERASRPVLLVTAHLDDADEAQDELAGLEMPVLRLPALESLPGESGTGLELFAERVSTVRRALELMSGEPAVVVAPIQALMQLVPEPGRLDSVARTIARGDEIDPTELAHWLDDAGYRRCDAIEDAGDFAVRGGIMDVFAPGGEPVRLDFFGDEVEKITAIDLETMGSDRAIDRVELVNASAGAVQTDEGVVGFWELLPAGAVAVLAETMEIVEQARGYHERVLDSTGIVPPEPVLAALRGFHAFVEVGRHVSEASVELPVGSLALFDQDAEQAVRELGELASESAVRVFCQNDAERARLLELFSQFIPEAAGSIETSVAYLHRGFVWRGPGDDALVAVPHHELLHRYQTRRRVTRLRAGRAMDTFLEIQPGDYVVHAEHGIARFAALKVMKPRRRPGGPPTEPEEYMTLEFKGSSSLHVPVSQIDQVQKYVGGFSGRPPLSTLGGKKWAGQKQRVSDSVRDLAAEMLRVRAARGHMPGIRYPADTAWQTEFEAEFPYQETDDQIAALAEIKNDMQSDRPMDRLLCGDVGFGKTELAIRAAFKACEFGKQVAVLVPTTVLAEQHERTFRARFADYPFKVESLSRFKTDKEINDTLAAVRKGAIDVIVGTHRLLSKDVRFADLGLVVIDEEQRFGVEHKERLLRLRMTVDVLTLSATPIPRTLHMSMLGLRDISSLTTAPLDRRAIVTEVVPYDEHRVRSAIERELAREGQVYYVHNRVHDIRSVADEVRRLAPDARIVVGHGQMPPRELEAVMLAFIRREADILVATTIIESGIDIPTANTMIIDDADRFGLADLHQLRGRVGRSRHRAYCYLLLPPERPVTQVARRRLRAIEQYSMLGAGFRIAMRDLEIRGAGNLLGAEQSGHIAAVGYEMFCRLLERAVHELKSDRPERPPSATTLDIGVGGVIPKAYIPSDARRLEAYRRLATAPNAEALDRVRADLTQAYGEPPAGVTRLLDLAALRIAAAGLGVRAVVVREHDVVLMADDPAPAAAALDGARGATVRVLAPKADGQRSEIYFRPPPAWLEPATLLTLLGKRLAAPPANSPEISSRR